MPSTLPTFHTEHLLLRKPSEQDLPGLLRLGLQREVTPVSHRHLEVPGSHLHKTSGTGTGYCSVFPKEQPYDLLGWVYLLAFPEREDLQLGCLLHTSAWERGWTAEACNAVLNHAFHSLGIRRVLLHPDPDHASSRKVAEQLGFQQDQGQAEQAPPLLVLTGPRSLVGGSVRENICSLAHPG